MNKIDKIIQIIAKGNGVWGLSENGNLYHLELERPSYEWSLADHSPTITISEKKESEI